MKPWKWVDKWLLEEGHNPKKFGIRDKKIFAELAENGPMTYKEISKRLTIPIDRVWLFVKHFLEIEWIVKEAKISDKDRPVVVLRSIYRVGE